MLLDAQVVPHAVDDGHPPAHGDDHPPAVGKLRDERGRHVERFGGDEDAVVRAVVGPAEAAGDGLLDARRASFAPMADAVALTGMEYGGITPIGLPADWRVLVDARVRDVPDAIVGAGIRAAKIAVPGAVLCALPGVVVVDGLATG